MVNHFWEGKKILISGHTGFKGSWLSIWLHQLGAEILGLSLEAEDKRSIFYKAQVSSIVENLYADIRDINSFKKTITDFKPEIVFHLAAQPLVRDSYSDPIKTLETNIIGTANILECLKEIDSVKSIVVVTSDKCYDNNEINIPFVESDPMGGHDPYSASKGCAELVTQSYRNSFLKDQGIFIASVRAGNVIGGGDWSKDRLIPDLVNSVREGIKVKIRNPKSVRPWQHVLEPLCGYINLAKKLYEEVPGSDSAWNFGPNSEDEKEVQWVVENFLKMSGSESLWELNQENNPHETGYLRLNSIKAINKLDWHPKWNTYEALQKTYDWYKESLSLEDMTKFSLDQIKAYENLDKV